jgi:hypothetical protein
LGNTGLRRSRSKFSPIPQIYEGRPFIFAAEFPLTYQTDPYVTDDVHEDDEISDRKLVSRILIVTILVGIGCGSALAWRWPFRFGAIPPVPVSSTTDAAPVDKPTGNGDLAALRQMITESTQASQRLLAAQDAEIKRLSDQVLALSSKLELMHPMTSAQAAMPMPTPGPAGAPIPAAAQRAAPHTAQKKLDPQKPVTAEQPDIRRAGR